MPTQHIFVPENRLREGDPTMHCESTSFSVPARAVRNNYDLVLDFKFCSVKLLNKKMSCRFAMPLKQTAQVQKAIISVGNAKLSVKEEVYKDV